MTINQIKNLVGFTILFNYDTSMLLSSPDYILEKYNTFINLDINHTVEFSDKFEKFYYEYQSKWKYNDDKLKIIMYYLFRFNRYSPNISIIFKRFKLIIGDYNNINNNTAHLSLHILLRNKILEPYLEKNFNKRIIKIYSFI